MSIVSSNQEFKILAVTDRPSYSGIQEGRIFGVALPEKEPRSQFPSGVGITIKNPQGIVMKATGVNVGRENGAFTLGFKTGGSEEWTNGEYGVAIHTSNNSATINFDYTTTETETHPSIPQRTNKQLPFGVVEKWLPTSPESKSLDDLYWELGQLMWSMNDPEFRSLMPPNVYDRTTAAALSRTDVEIAMRRMVKRYWKPAIDFACDWAKDHPNMTTAGALVSLAAALTAILPPVLAALIAALITQAGIEVICSKLSPEPPAPPLSGMD